MSENIMSRIEKIEKNLSTILNFLDRNKDGHLNGADALQILEDALKESQKNDKELISTMQSNFNAQMENFQKKSLADKIIWIVGSIGVFLLSVFL